MPITYECRSCSWQGKYHETDSGHCPECDGETFPLDVIYENGCFDEQGKEMSMKRARQQ